MRRLATRVLVVGGGPVGTTLAMDLAWRGIDVVVAEQRHRGEPPSVKCNHVAARTMEIFRRLGVAQRVRDAGLPPTMPMTWRSAPPRPASSSRASRSRAGATATPRTDGPDGWWPTPEPPHRINQIYLEPVLVELRRGDAAICAISTASRCSASRRPTTAVTAEAQDLDTGETLTDHRRLPDRLRWPALRDPHARSTRA